MNQYLYIIGIISLISCGNKNNISLPPTEKCENISIDNLPVITHGFYSYTYDSVILKTFVKNSKFDTLLDKYIVKLSVVTDKERIQRYFSFPREINTGSDIQIVFNDILTYKITEIQTAWIERDCQSSCYECTISSFKINDSLVCNEGGNIYIKEPNFKYPWMKQ